MRRILPALCVSAMLALAAPAQAARAHAMPAHDMPGHAAPAARAAPAKATPGPVTIKIANFTFAAPVVTVAPGTTVTWVNEDDIPHTIVADDKKAFRSKVLDTGDSFSFTFASAGSFGYFCSIHPHMTGKVVVKGS